MCGCFWSVCAYCIHGRLKGRGTELAAKPILAPHLAPYHVRDSSKSSAPPSFYVSLNLLKNGCETLEPNLFANFGCGARNYGGALKKIARLESDQILSAPPHSKAYIFAHAFLLVWFFSALVSFLFSHQIRISLKLFISYANFPGRSLVIWKKAF